MVNQQLLRSSPPSDETLEALWRSTALRLTVRQTIVILGLGVTGAVGLIMTDRPRGVAALSVLAAAFGCYAAILQPALGGRWLRPRAQRFGALLMSVVAGVAAVVVALSVLVAVFGGSLEVMRR